MDNGTRLSVDLSDIKGIPLVQVHGEIDLYTAPQLERALEVGIGRGTPALIIDLSNASYVDSAGLSALLWANKALSARDADLYVVAPPSNRGVRRVLEITRLDTLFRVRDSIEDVLKELKSPKAA